MTAAEIKTARLWLRPVAAFDEAAVVAGMNDLDVSGWLSVVPYPYGAADFRHFAREIARPGETYAVDDDQGFAGIVRAGDTLGYWFLPRCHGRGYATEACWAALSYQFADHAEPVMSGYFEGNGRSARVLEKLGFVETGRGMAFCRPLARDRVHVDLALLRPGFEAAFPVEARSARLAYRALWPHDLNALHALVSQWDVVRQLGGYPWPADRAHTATRAKPYAGNGFIWAILRDGAMIGTVGVWDGELGYMLDPAHHRQGFGEEACRFALARAFGAGALPEVHAGVWADNAASLALLAKLGFEITAQTREPSLARGVPADGYTLRLTAARWENPSGA